MDITLPLLAGVLVLVKPYSTLADTSLALLLLPALRHLLPSLWSCGGREMALASRVSLLLLLKRSAAQRVRPAISVLCGCMVLW